METTPVVDGCSPWGSGMAEETQGTVRQRARTRLGRLGLADELPVDGFFGGERIVTGRKQQRRSSRMESSSVKDEGDRLPWGDRSKMGRQRSREERQGGLSLVELQTDELGSVFPVGRGRK
jgi:hypothetical protein